MRKILLAMGLSMLASAAVAQDWVDSTPAQPDRAFYEARNGGKTLMLGCYRSQQHLSFTLLGGAEPLHASLRGEPALLVWITLSDGRTGRYAIDTEYLGGGDNALIGKLMLGSEGKQFFAQGTELSISGSDAGTFFSTGLSGSARAMEDFRATCGL
ncbi:hypothetical protein ACGTN6_15595 [Halomonas sp. THAF12]|uniref:hypothetical protein n=1 Tax=Halomonas sp. B23F22_10 TaxID=3459515 RepID=UPI00373F3FED